MTSTPQDVDYALKYAADQHRHLNPPAVYHISTWAGRCQQLAHTEYGLLTGGFGTAYLQWLGADAEDKHVTSDFSKAPVGSFGCTKGDNPAGHIFLMARPFADGTKAGWSNDIVRTGFVNKVDRNAFRDNWGHRNLGFIFTINGYVLDLTRGILVPKQNKRYARVENAISNLGNSLDDLRHARRSMQFALKTAKDKGDQHDADILQRQVDNIQGDIDHVKKEMERLQTLYTNLRHS